MHGFGEIGKDPRRPNLAAVNAKFVCLLGSLAKMRKDLDCVGPTSFFHLCGQGAAGREVVVVFRLNE